MLSAHQWPTASAAAAAAAVAAWPCGAGAPASSTWVECTHAGIENWPSVHRRLLRLLDGTVKGDALGLELARMAARREHNPHRGFEVFGDCLPGEVALHFLLALSENGVGVKEAAALLEEDWRRLNLMGWPLLIRTGWPVFRLLRMLKRRLEQEHGQVLAGRIPGCSSDGEEDFAALLRKHVRYRRAHAGESLLARSAAYLASSSATEFELCPLSAAAAFLVGSWGRFPVYDEETEEAIELAQSVVERLQLSHLLATDHAFFDLLDDVSSAYQAFLIDSGWLYKDPSPSDATAPVVDYTRHMDGSNSNSRPTNERQSSCPPPLGLTPLGRCNPFAYLGTSLSPWRRTDKGVAPTDTARAFLHAIDAAADEVALVRHSGHELLIVSLPSAKVDSIECLAQGILSVLSRAPLPVLEFVVSFADRPLLPHGGSSQNKQGHAFQREHVPLPIFSVCTGTGFWDIPFPGLCPIMDGNCRHVQGSIPRQDHRREEEHFHDPRSAARQGTQQETLETEEVVTPLAAILNEFGMAECYGLRLFSAFAELLTYVPGGPEEETEGGPFFGALPQGSTVVLHRWQTPGEVAPERVATYTSRCTRLIDAAAQ